MQVLASLFASSPGRNKQLDKFPFTYQCMKLMRRLRNKLVLVCYKPSGCPSVSSAAAETSSSPLPDLAAATLSTASPSVTHETNKQTTSNNKKKNAFKVKVLNSVYRRYQEKKKTDQSLISRSLETISVPVR